MKPLQYFEKAKKEEEFFMNTDGFKKARNIEKKHTRNQSCQPEQINMGHHEKNYQIRSIFHLILRFHKVKHRKCKHVEEFLYRLGYGDCI